MFGALPTAEEAPTDPLGLLAVAIGRPRNQRQDLGETPQTAPGLPILKRPVFERALFGRPLYLRL
jgi:hypothetical protein